jgi:hypothetical protein
MRVIRVAVVGMIIHRMNVAVYRCSMHGMMHRAMIGMMVRVRACTGDQDGRERYG